MLFHPEARKRQRLLALGLGALSAAVFLGLFLFTPLKSQLYIVAPFSLAVGAVVWLCLRYRVEARSWWGMLAVNAVISACSILVLQLPMYTWASMRIHQSLLVNMGFVMGILCLVTAVTADMKVFGLLWLTVCLIFGAIDFAVVQFSGNFINFSNFADIDTAASVASQYRLHVTPCLVLAALLFALTVLAILRLKQDRPRLKKLPVRLAALACAVALGGAGMFFFTHRRAMLFSTMGIRHNGVLGELIIEALDSVVSVPKGYSDDRIEALSRENALPAAEEEKINVIAVMVESFSDLNVLGNLKTNVDYMPFTRSLADQAIHGFALASTIGGGTARSEWEFLTGNSMAFMPEGGSPYSQFMNGTCNSAVRAFKNAGYHTIAMHPYRAAGWHRSTVYPKLGFDDIYFINDLEWDGYVRGYVSDSAFVHQLINLYENRPQDKPLFFFGVTMQDHGGYEDEDFVADVHIEGMEGEYPSVEQFLSLARLTDDAIREMIEYFSAAEEKVEIVFFGDHQPKVPNEFPEALGGTDRNLRYLVPFVIWNNYDQRAEEVPLTSLNFLMARTMEEAGVSNAPYFNFLSRLSRTVPAVYSEAYVHDGRFHDLDDDPEGLLSDYRVYQYGNIFREALATELFVGEGE